MTQLKGNEVDMLTDAIISKVADGDSDAFHTLYYCTHHAVYGYILSFLKNPHDSEDAMQDTYLRIRQKAQLYRPYGKPLAWVLTIAKNICLMRLRAGRTQSLFSLDDTEAFEGLPTIMDNSEDKMVLDAVLRLLDEQSRQVVILHAVTGLHHREIASALGLPLSTVLSRYNRSLAKLKKALNDGGNF